MNRYGDDGTGADRNSATHSAATDDGRCHLLRFSTEEWERWPAGPYLIISRADGRLLGGTGLGCEAPHEALQYAILNTHPHDGFSKSAGSSEMTSRNGARTECPVAPYLIDTTTMSTGMPDMFVDECGTPRPMNSTSPRAHVVFATLPSIVTRTSPAPSAITTWS